MRFLHTLPCLVLACLSVPAWADPGQSAKPAQDQAPKSKGSDGSDHLLGNWGGLRPKLKDAGVTLDLTYIGEAAADVSGGKKHGIAYAGEAAARITLDWGTIAGADGLSTHIALLNRHGKNASKLYVGDQLFNAQEIYGAGGGVAVHLGYLYFEQKLSGGAIDLKAGRLPVQTDFGTLEHACDFVALTVCSIRGLGANLGWTSYPRATWGASITGKVGNAVKLRTGIYEVNPHTGGDSGFHWSFEGAEGVMIPVEIEWSPQTASGLKATYKVGAFLNTARSPEWNTAINGAPLYATSLPAAKTTREGGYALAEQQLTDNGRGGGLTMMAGIVYNSERTSLLQTYGFVGLLDQGPFPGRPNDKAGIEFTYGRVSHDLTERQRADVALGLPIANDAPGVQTHEEVVEAMYRFAAAPGLWLVPDIQWIHRPSGADAYPDALVLALGVKAQL